MTPDEMKELRELIEFLKENDIDEFEFERGDLKIRIEVWAAVSKRRLLRLSILPVWGSCCPRVSMRRPSASQGIHAVASAGVGVAAADAAAAEADEEQLHIVKSPIVGTFYESSSPGAAAFVKIGDEIENGQVLCIVEAMKLMNEIESDAAGEVVKRLVTNGQPVEYGQPLFALRLR